MQILALPPFFSFSSFCLAIQRRGKISVVRLQQVLRKTSGEIRKLMPWSAMLYWWKWNQYSAFYTDHVLLKQKLNVFLNESNYYYYFSLREVSGESWAIFSIINTHLSNKHVSDHSSITHFLQQSCLFQTDILLLSSTINLVLKKYQLHLHCYFKGEKRLTKVLCYVFRSSIRFSYSGWFWFMNFTEFRMLVAYYNVLPRLQ